MLVPPPKPPEEITQVESFAETLLGRSNVASVRAETLRKQGIDVRNLDRLLSKYIALPPAQRSFSIQKNFAEPGNPDDFGLLVRRVPAVVLR